MMASGHETSVRVVGDIIASSDVLFVTEASPWGKLGYETAATAFSSIHPVYWSPGMPKPDLNGWQGDWIICFKADLVLPRAVLDRAKKGAINLHPAPPKYRGLGGYWWALNNNDTVYGVTVHHMNEKIDHGAIIKVDSFPIWPSDTEQSLKHRAAIHSLTLLKEMLATIVSGCPLTPSGATWGHHLYTAKELELAQHAQANRALSVVVAIHDEMAGLDGRETEPLNTKLALG